MPSVTIPPNPYPQIAPQYWNALRVNCATANPPVDPVYMGSIMMQESQGNPNAFNPNSNDYGLMQINEANLKAYPGADTDPYKNIAAGVDIFSNNLRNSGGDYATATAKYNAGGNYNSQAGQNYVSAVDKHYEQVGAPNGTINDSINKFKSNNPTPSRQEEQDPPPTITPDTTAQPISGQTLTTGFINSLDPKLQIDFGLDETPWYDDQGLITGNPHARKSTQPVSFTVYLDQAQPSLILHSGVSRGNAPIQIQLNCSMKEFSIEMKHVFTRTPSRTGMHITFWGQTPDLITGSGSTGVFMNQFGITDWFSVANISDEMKDAVLNGMINTATNALQASTNTQPYSPDDIFSYVVQKQAKQNPQEAFRVAAQDAFVEFMKLFQMNGVVWFTTENYQGYQTGQEQYGQNAWGSNKPGAGANKPGTFATGASTFQQTARNNDVLTRGYVAMKFKNSVYLGYFKSLNWTQDAEKPFSWDFNFVFQVEKTISALFYSDAGVTTGDFVQPTTSIINNEIK